MAPPSSSTNPDRFYYANGAGHPVGPFSGDDVRRMAATGLLPPDTLVRKADESDWKPLQRLLPSPPPSLGSEGATTQPVPAPRSIPGASESSWDQNSTGRLNAKFKDNLLQVSVTGFLILAIAVYDLAIGRSLLTVFYHSLIGFILGVIASGAIIAIRELLRES
ncbi:MAG: DUF4339 domain-containing protein [Verrucomicrobiae bacterium]|nr:DUF4339 domain-containing protein [Verrucomicrobiae bacterium]